jgi:hypothetical protein
VFFPELVNSLELLGFVGKLLLNILSIEDILEIHPGLLENEPLIEDIRDITQSLFPAFDSISDFINVF